MNVRVGGFYRAPSPEQIAALAEPLRARSRRSRSRRSRGSAGFDFPDVEGDYLFVALHEPDRYAIESGRVALLGRARHHAGRLRRRSWWRSTWPARRRCTRGSTGATPTSPVRWRATRSTGDQLGVLARQAADAAGLGATCRNPFQSIVVRSVELVVACDEALRLVESYEPPEPPAVEVPPRAGVGVGATEAPRGLLFHRYELDADGLIASARIVPPTSQNQLSIEADLRRVVEEGLELDDDALTWRCEQAVRNHDPCISCAAHFLEVEVVRS